MNCRTGVIVRSSTLRTLDILNTFQAIWRPKSSQNTGATARDISYGRYGNTHVGRRKPRNHSERHNKFPRKPGFTHNNSPQAQAFRVSFKSAAQKRFCARDAV